MWYTFILCSLCKFPLCIIVISAAAVVIVVVVVVYYYYYYYLLYNGYTPPGVLSYWLFRNDVQQLGSHVRVDEYTRSCHKLCYKYNVT
jgi:hypothetical protein